MEKIYFGLVFKSLEQKFKRLELRFDETNERIDIIELSSQKEQLLKLLVCKKEKNPYRHTDEDDYRKT